MSRRRIADPPPEAPLYDARFEHDACGVGFVADAGGRQRGRVLPLALAGLAALGHRGAFAADGRSSDGAGVSLPLEPDVLADIAAGAGVSTRGRRVGVVSLFIPPGRAGRPARELVSESLAAEGLAAVGWRAVPIDRAALGPSAAESLPEIHHVLVAAGRGDRLELALACARRRMEAAARDAALPGFAVPSASSRVVVYKGLVAGERLAAFYPDLARPWRVSHAVFHQRYATNTRPDWRLAQPFRRLAHNGEIDTVRGNREQVRGRAGDPLRTAAARRLAAAGPLLSPDGSDSLSLDEAVELLEATGWDAFAALLALVPGSPMPAGAEAAGAESILAPWDGPGAFVATDGRRVGALLDRNALRPLAFLVTRERLVVAASEAGAVPIAAAEVVRRGRLGPGGLLLVDPRRGLVLEDAAAVAEAHRGAAMPAADDRTASAGGGTPATPVYSPFVDRPVAPGTATGAPLRFLFGLDAERHRLHLRTMVVEGHEPLWSMGDDTPTPGLGRVDRPITDHLRQAFAQVTNPPIDPDRERWVIDLSVELGRRRPLLGGPRTAGRGRTVRVGRPYVADLEALVARFGERARVLDASWAAGGDRALDGALDSLVGSALAAASDGAELLVVSDRRATLERPPIPTAIAVGAIHAELTRRGLRGRADIVADAGDVVDVHAAAMAIAVGATVVHPRLAIELAAELAGTRGAEDLSAEAAIERLLDAFAAGLRKTLARMGISTAASYAGAGLAEAMELAPDVLERCFPAVAAWPGTVDLATIERRILRRAVAAAAVAADAAPNRLPDPGLARFRSDGEHHGYSPSFVGAVQALAARAEDGTGAAAGRVDGPETALVAYRDALRRDPATVREQLEIAPAAHPVPLAEVEPATSIVRRFVASAMSVGALSPEAHQAVTLGMQRAGGAANTGEGGEDPEWYRPGRDGERRDARIKQVASGRFGVTTEYLARADQLEIKIAQGSKPGEGGQLPGRKATAYIAALRRGQAGQAYISPPPHHDIYSIEDLAQLIADLRTVAPGARVGVKLVSTRGVGTIAAGVAKAGADYVHIAGHAGGTGASPLASIKHVGAPWELGLAEAHQVLLRSGLRDRVALRTDGGLRSGRDVVVAALLGAEEFGFGTALLVALGCDMARQCHLDTCPTGIATQRDDLRAKFGGAPDDVARLAIAIAEDVRRELAAIGARSVGEIVGEAAVRLRPAPDATLDLGAVVGAPRWIASAGRRASPASAGDAARRRPASPVEASILEGLRAGRPPETGPVEVTTADRSVGAAVSGAVARGEIAGPVRLDLRGAAGQSLGAFAGVGVRIEMRGVANDYVAKGLSGGVVVVAPESDLASPAERSAIAGNTCLFGATSGRLHVVGRAGMRFAVRNSGATAVAEGIGAHGCEYMTGGTVVVLGPVGSNFGAGMTGGRAFVWDASGQSAPAVDRASVSVTRLDARSRTGDEGETLVGDLCALLADHAAAGSALATRLLATGGLEAAIWVVEPLPAVSPPAMASRPAIGPRAPAPSPPEAPAPRPEAPRLRPPRPRIPADVAVGGG